MCGSLWKVHRLRLWIFIRLTAVLLMATMSALVFAADGMSPTLPVEAGTLQAGAQSEQPIAFSGLPLALGDTYQQIETRFGKLELEHTHSINDAEIPTVRLRRAGVMLFFDDLLILKQIRVDRPFGGDFAGTKVGQRKADVVRLLGSPDRTGDFGFGRDMTFFYDRAHFVLRFDFGRVLAFSAGYATLDTRLMTIRLIRKPSR